MLGYKTSLIVNHRALALGINVSKMGKLIEMVGRLLPAALETDFPRHQTLVLPLLRYMTSHKLFYTLSHLLILDENASS